MAIKQWFSSVTPGYGKLLSEMQRRGFGPTQEWQTTVLDSAGNRFATDFYQAVGREPTQDELSRFYDAVAPNMDKLNTQQFGIEPISSLTKDFVSSNFVREAEQETGSQLQAQQAEAARLSDLFRTQGMEAVNSTEQSLLDYQGKLFERLRPNLITSLQSQGLLNTGGLNTAIAGAQSDLATAGSNELRDKRLAVEMGANDIKFAGQAAPYQFQQGLTMSRLPYLQQQGQSALDKAYNEWNANQNYQRELGLIAAKRGGGKGGFFGQIANSFAPAFGSALGQSLGNWTFSKQNEDTGASGSGLGALFV